MVEERRIAIAEPAHDALVKLMLRNQPAEEVCFGLVYPSTGPRRRSLLLRKLIEPMPGERMVHGNASFSAPFTNRAIDRAIDEGAGLALIHSHPMGTGAQWPSGPDRVAEARTLETAFHALRGMPVAGMIVAGDGTVSGREYVFPRPGSLPEVYDLSGAHVVGQHLRQQGVIDGGVTMADVHASHVGLWGRAGQATLHRLRVGVVGAGSIGMCIIEQLARIGIGELVIIDYDRIEFRNLNRQYGYFRPDAERRERKARAAERHAHRAATAPQFRCKGHVASVLEPEGLRLLLDCDVVFSCADSHWSRQVLNTLAYAHLIPVVDAGSKIAATADGTFQTASCRVQVVSPTRGCLECSKAFLPENVAEEMSNVQAPHYAGEAGKVVGEPSVIPLNTVASGFAMLQFMELSLGILGQLQPQQRYDFRGGDVALKLLRCRDGCAVVAEEARGDLVRLPVGVDPRFTDRPEAEEMRPGPRWSLRSAVASVLKSVTSLWRPPSTAQP